MPSQPFPRLVLAGTHSGVGKTTVTLALLAALQSRGRRVQAFKVGPDFIDPGHHRAITGRPSRTLDGWMLGASLNRRTFQRAAAEADLSIIEGVMGLFDGSSPVSDVGSTAEMAKLLGAPVLLVIDGSAMARSAAAMVLGYQQFDPALRVAGVLFNRVRGPGHYGLLKAAVEQVLSLPVVGHLPPDPDLTIPDRHLGLTTALEHHPQGLIERLGKAAADTINLDLVEALAESAEALPADAPCSVPVTVDSPVQVGVAYDPAFCFYYEENLELLEAAGAQLVRFSPLHDPVPPAVDLLYLGGGYPELHAEGLSKNEPMRRAIRQFSLRGGAVYAECGGLMYLMETLRDCEQRAWPMVGVFPGETAMNRSGLTIGYRELQITRACVLGAPGTTVRGHEFHYSSLRPDGPVEYHCRLRDARGRDCGPDGLSRGNTLALYTHLHFASQPSLPRALLNSARQWRMGLEGRSTNASPLTERVE